MKALRMRWMSRLWIALAGLVPVGASAATPELDACRAALQRARAGSVEGTPAQLAVGPHRVIVGNTEERGGFVCLLGAKAPGSIVADLAVGMDVVGRIARPRVFVTAGEPFLTTVQTFRGGSNAKRQLHVVYAFVGGRIRKALELPEDAERAIGNYVLAEKNELTPKQAALAVAQQMRVSKLEGKNAELYRASRAFDLVWKPEFSSFVEGVGTCAEDYVVDRRPWLEKGQRFGYIFRPGLADAGGLTLTLVRQDGGTVELTDLEDLVFLRLAVGR